MPQPFSAQQRRRANNLLFINKLLSQRDNVSPLTLIADSLEQSGRPVVREILRRVKATGAGAKTKSIFVSFETLRQPRHVDVFVAALDILVTRPERLIDEILASMSTSVTAASSEKTLIIIDNIFPLIAHSSQAPDPLLISHFLSSLLARPHTSLVVTLHVDIPMPSSTTSTQDPYAPAPQTLLTYLATTVITPHSTTHVLAAREAKNRSLPSPAHGLGEEVEGVLVGLGSNGNGNGKDAHDAAAVVLEVEHRRKSGRSVRDWYVLASSATRLPRPEITTTGFKSGGSMTAAAGAADTAGTAMLLEDWGPYARLLLPPTHLEQQRQDEQGKTDQEEEEGGRAETTFSLGLTEKQRRDRERVVLPYFDAQAEGGGGGGRILYQMGDEDDFDEEEDEI